MLVQLHKLHMQSPTCLETEMLVQLHKLHMQSLTCLD